MESYAASARAGAPQAALPDAGRRSATRRSSRPGRRGGSSRARSRSPRSCRARTSSLFSNLPSDRATSTLKAMETPVQPPQAAAGRVGDGLAGEGQPLRVQRQERVRRVRPLGGGPRRRRRRSRGSASGSTSRSRTSRRWTRPGARRKSRRGGGPGGRRRRNPRARAPSGRSWAC